MTHPARIDYELRREMPATLQAAEEFFAEFRRRSRALLKRPDSFAVELMVREALTNAVVHGCHKNPSKQVRCSLRLKSGRLLIAVEDDGDGFDWRTASGNSARISDCSGRGIEILRKYSNRVRYNDKGNAVMISKRFC